MTTRPITFYRATPIPDGAGGATAGVPVVVGQALAMVKPLKGVRDVDGTQLRMNVGYALSFYVNPAYTPLVGDLVEVWEGDYMSIQSVQYSDATRRRYELTVLG